MDPGFSEFWVFWASCVRRKHTSWGNYLLPEIWQFENFNTLFSTLNKQNEYFEYAILRSFGNNDYALKSSTDADIDILVNDYYFFKGKFSQFPQKQKYVSWRAKTEFV